MDHDISPIFSRPMRVSGLGDKPTTRSIEAKPAELTALATLFNLPDIQTLRGHFTLTHQRAGTITAHLTLSARLTQTCVVTLEPFESDLHESTELLFVPAASIKESAEIDLDPETLEAPDEIPYTAETIDLGAVLAEQLALSLNPYPKKPGATLEPTTDNHPQNPFAALLRKPGS